MDYLRTERALVGFESRLPCYYKRISYATAVSVRPCQALESPLL